jgi:nitrogenase molybdenum-iron protein alpha/beta subunit
MVSVELKEKRSLDEGFWQDLEARLKSNIGQPCCTLSGISFGLITMAGDFAVVIHGEHECAACFHHVGPSVDQFYCVGLDEADFTSGQTRGKLRECLELVVKETNPGVVFVLGACPIEIIGDRFETTVEEVSQETGTPMVSLHTSGLKVGSQAAMLDWMFETLTSLPQLERSEMSWVSSEKAFYNTGATEKRGRLPAKEYSLNIIGLPEWRRGNVPEWYRVLSDVGLNVVGNMPYGGDLSSWRSLSHASATFVADRRLYPRLFSVLEGFDQEIIEVPLPIGVKQTDEFYRTIGRFYGLEDEIMASASQRREEACQALEKFSGRVNGIRMAMGLRMLNNYRADQLAYEGLGDVEAMAEMGFDLTLLVQGPPEDRFRVRFEETFQQLGCELPFDIFPEPWGISKRLKAGGFDAAYLADHCRLEAREANVPMVVSRELQPFYEGVTPNLIRMGKRLEEILDI